MSKDDVYAFAEQKLALEKPIDSLKKLGPNQLKHLLEFLRRVSDNQYLRRVWICAARIR